MAIERCSIIANPTLSKTYHHKNLIIFLTNVEYRKGLNKEGKDDQNCDVKAKLENDF